MAETLITLLAARYVEQASELSDIAQRAADESGREYTESEQTRSAELESSLDALNTRIEQLTEREEKINKTHERSKIRARVDEGPDASKDHPVQVRAEPTTYGPGSAHEFLRDLLVYKAGGLGLDVMPSTEVHERMARHITETKVDHTHRRAVNSGNLAGIVNPMYDPATIARGIYTGAVSKMLLRQYALPAEGDSITVPRVTTKASAGVQATEGTAFKEASLATAAVKFDVFTIALRLPVSVQAIERGSMSMELMQDEIIEAWMEECNRNALFGDNSDDEPIGILYQNAANPLNPGGYDEFDESAPSGLKLLDQITDTETAVGEARHRSPDAIITGIGTWGRLRKSRDSDGRRLLSPDERTGRNVDGMGRVVAEDATVARSVGSLDNVDVFTDPAIPRTFADTGAKTGGTQGRVIVLHRGSMLWMDDGPSSFTYEQTLAASGQVLLVVRGYAAFNPGWHPSACRVIYGTGTVI